MQKPSHKSLESGDERPSVQPTSAPVLVIEADPAMSDRLNTILESDGYPVACVNSEGDLLHVRSWLKVSGIVCGNINRDDIDAIDFFSPLIQQHPELSNRVIFLACNPTDRSLAKR